MTDAPHATTTALCGAKTRSGVPCKSPAMSNGRCRMHGGKSLAGMASPTFVDGRHSKYMPKRLLEKYSEALADPRITKYDDDFALIETLLTDRLSLVDTGESARLWQETRKEAERIFKAVDSEDYSGAVIAAQHIQEMAGKAMTIHEAIADLIGLFEQKRKLRDSYQRYLVQAGQVMTMDQTMTLIAALTSTVRKHVTDRQTLNAISAELTAIISAKAS